MIRALFYIVLVFAFGLGFAWLADRPGDLVLTWSGMRYEVSLIVAVAALAALVVFIMLVWWIIKSIIRSPHLLRRHFRARKRDRGYQSLSTGLIAAGAGDAGQARTMAKQARKLLNVDVEPLFKLLDAQTAMLEGKTDEARAKFEAMLDDPETKLLGLRGLYLEAQRVGAREAANHYAEKASEAAPQLEWAANASLGKKTAEGDWDGALKLLDGMMVSRRIDRDMARRDRAVLLTAKAVSMMDTDPMAAKNAAVEANRLQPDLVPAAVTAARILFRQGEIRRGSKILEANWKIAPHPDVATTYVRARPGDSAQDRLKRASHLFSVRPNHPDASLALAQAELDAGHFKEARELATAVIRSTPRESAYLLLADIEEAETGDQGKVRQWLARAVKAPRDPAWTADGYVSDHWMPVSPVTGKLNAFEWKVPVEQLSPVIESEDLVEPVGETPGKAPEPEAPVADEPAAPVVVVAEPATKPVPTAETKAVPADAPAPAEPVEAVAESAEPVETPRSQPVDGTVEPIRPDGGDVDEETTGRSQRLPDDPGVAPEEAPSDNRRFRLF